MKRKANFSIFVGNTYFYILHFSEQSREGFSSTQMFNVNMLDLIFKVAQPRPMI